MRIFVLPEDLAQRLERWAQDRQSGGWQSICARVLECEFTPRGMNSKEARIDGITMSIENLVALAAAERDEDAES